MNLNRRQVDSTIKVLKEVLINNRYTDKTLEKIFKIERALTDEDKAFIAETSYDIVRYYRLLLTVSNSESLWKILGTWAVLNNYELNAWKEFERIDTAAIHKQYKEVRDTRKIKESIPDWLDSLGEQELGDKWVTELHALNQKPDTFIRANTLKTNLEDLQKLLREEDITTQLLDVVPGALRVLEKQNLFKSSAFQQGLFEVQDAGSQCIAPFLALEPGMRVIDACCGTGGKTLQLAALMKNKGRLIAMDVSNWKLDELKKRTKRAGVDNLEIKFIESSKTIKRLVETADRLLLDVPCSGLGVLKRNPDAKWSLQEDYVARLIKQQQSILNQYSAMVKKGGQLVYATCSILPSENEHQIKNFLAEHSAQFELVEEKHILPSQGFDGFYMARLKRLP